MSIMKLDSFADSVTKLTGGSKADQHGWPPIQGEHPELRYIDKHDLCVDHTYQRDHNVDRKGMSLIEHQCKIAREWDWAIVGAIAIIVRGDKNMVVDGQQRVLAAMRRDEISKLPCAVTTFPDESPAAIRKLEAKAFMGHNDGRAVVTPFLRYRAGLIAGDPDARAIESATEKAGLVVCQSGTVKGGITCVGAIKGAIKWAGFDTTVQALSLCKAMEPSGVVTQRLFCGVVMLLKNPPQPLPDAFWTRAVSIGANYLATLIEREINITDTSGEKTWANAIIKGVNKYLRRKFELYEIGVASPNQEEQRATA